MTLNGLAPGGEYAFRVRVRNLLGYSPYSSERVFSTTSAVFCGNAPFEACFSGRQWCLYFCTDATTIYLNIVTTSFGWVGLIVGATNGMLGNGDVMVGTVSSGQANIYDRHTSDYTVRSPLLTRSSY